MFAVSVVDHFNGNYSVCCPPTPMPEASPCGHTIFSIRLSFTRFFAYQVMKRDESIDQKFATTAKRKSGILTLFGWLSSVLSVAWADARADVAPA